MEAEFRYLKKDHYASKNVLYSAIPYNLDLFEIVETIQVQKSDGPVSQMVPVGVYGEEKFYLIYVWNCITKCWVGTRAAHSYIYSLFMECDEVADISLLITESIPKLRVEIP